MVDLNHLQVRGTTDSRRQEVDWCVRMFLPCCKIIIMCLHCSENVSFVWAALIWFYMCLGIVSIFRGMSSFTGVLISWVFFVAWAALCFICLWSRLLHVLPIPHFIHLLNRLFTFPSCQGSCLLNFLPTFVFSFHLFFPWRDHFTFFSIFCTFLDLPFQLLPLLVLLASLNMTFDVVNTAKFRSWLRLIGQRLYC